MRAPEGRGWDIPVASVELLSAAVNEIEAAVAHPQPADRYIRGHLVARRAAAAVLAARVRPARSGPQMHAEEQTGSGSGSGSGPGNIWSLLPAVAPELREWAEFFAAGTGKRIAAEAGLTQVISAREADDLVRDAHNFLDIVVTALARGMSRQAI